jgi:uncharacterized protein YndB with AHSA1/START domain
MATVWLRQGIRQHRLDGMAFPDRIERTIDLGHAPATVWAAVTTAEGLASWFGHHADIDLRPGGAAHLAWDDGAHHELRVERADEPSVFAFTWQFDGMPDDDARRTYVELILEPAGDPVGTSTRLTVVETGFAQFSDDQHAVAYPDHLLGWERELGELSDYLDAA